MKFCRVLVKTLVIIGALSWGLVGAFDFDFVAYFFGNMPAFSRLIYILIGLAGLWLFIGLFRRCGPTCGSKE